MADIVRVHEEDLNVDRITYGDLTWISIMPPTTKELEYLSAHFGFHPLDLDDTLTRTQRPKIDEYRDYLFIVFNFPRYFKSDAMMGHAQLSVFIKDNYLITIHKGELKPLIGLFESVAEDKELAEDIMTKGSGYLLYRVLDRLVDYCMPILNKISDNIEDIEDDIFSSNKTQTLRDITRIRRDIIAFRRTIWPMRTVISSLEPRIREYTTTDLTVFFGDISDHLDKIWDGLNEHKEVIESLHSTYDSLSSQHVNNIMRILTMFTAIGAVLQIVVGFYGMNVWLPGGNDMAGFRYSWLIIVGVMLVLSLIILWYFKHKDWL
jgi:magnesium transporter